MPQPTISDVHIDRYLSNLSVGYLQTDGFVAGSAFPMVPVTNKTDYYLKYNRGDFFRDDMKERAPGTPADSGGYKQAYGTYACKVWATKKVIDDQTASNVDAPMNLDRDATYWLTQKALINREVQWASTYFGTSIWGYERAGAGSTNGTTQCLYWDNTSGDPRLDILAARTSIRKNTGYWPNTLILGAKVEEKLVQNAKLIDLLKYGQAPGSRTEISNSDLAALFRVERVLTMSAIKTTSAEDLVGDSDTTPDTFDFIGGNHALLCYAAPSPGLFAPSAGYTFNWTGYTGANGAGMKIKKYRWEVDAAYHMEVEQTYGFGLVSKYMGAFFKDILTP